METPKDFKSSNGFWRKNGAAWWRWLHLYLSMISFAILFFFAVTGLTLNHTEWFNGQQNTQTSKGKMDSSWVNNLDTLKVEKLEVVEFLRSAHKVTGALSDFIIDDDQCTVAFSGPGYSADVFIDRKTGDYEITAFSAGFVGLINDLHKGRDTGNTWSLVIDISAILMILVSFTGIMMMLYLKRKRLVSILVVIIGLILTYLSYKVFVP